MDPCLLCTYPYWLHTELPCIPEHSSAVYVYTARPRLQSQTGVPNSSMVHASSSCALLCCFPLRSKGRDEKKNKKHKKFLSRNHTLIDGGEGVDRLHPIAVCIDGKEGSSLRRRSSL